jgi:hypothetical protein
MQFLQSLKQHDTDRAEDKNRSWKCNIERQRKEIYFFSQKLREMESKVIS